MPVLYSVVLVGQSNMVLTSPFIDDLLENYRVVICAKSGTNSLEWQKGGAVYARCLRRINNGALPVAAILHFQGEGNTSIESLSTHYLDDTKQLFLDLRQDISAFNASHGGAPGAVPIILAQLGQLPTDFERPYWNYIKNQQAKLPTKLPDTYMITTDDQPNCVGPHFCTEGHEVIAQRFVDKFFEVINGQ